MDERFEMGVYAAYGTKFVGECFDQIDPYASWKRFVSLSFSENILAHRDHRLETTATSSKLMAKRTRWKLLRISTIGKSK